MASVIMGGATACCCSCPVPASFRHSPCPDCCPLPARQLPQMALLPAALNLAWVTVYYLAIFVVFNKRITQRGYQNMCALLP